METLTILMYAVFIVSGIGGTLSGLRDGYFPGSRLAVVVFGILWTVLWSYALYSALT